MNRETSRASGARRAGLMLLCLTALAVGSVRSHAYTTAQFVSIQAKITNDLAVVAAIPNPTRDDLARLRALRRATNVLAKTSLVDGQELRSLNGFLGRIPSYPPVLGTVATNLLSAFDLEYGFVGTLLTELPPSLEATAITLQYGKLAPVAARLHASPNVASFASACDVAKRRLDAVYFRANQALIIPFPADLSPDSVAAKMNGINFRTSLGLASDNVFQASATASNISLAVNGLLISGGDGSARGLFFTVPNVQFGTFRYSIPTAASFTNRTGVYSADESNVGATSGSIFVSTTATEVYGSFSCSGPGFTVTDGRFRITITAAP